MKSKKTTTVNELICEKITVLRMNGKVPTARNYRALLHFIEKHFGLLKASDCDAACVMRMKTIMKDLSPSTQAGYLACLKSIWNYASYKGYTGRTEYPFQRHQFEIDKVRVPKTRKRTEHFLTIEQISKIYHHWFEMPDEKARDRSCKKYVGLFLFSYLGNGANVNDLIRLRYNNDWWNSDGKVLTFVRHKTEEKSPVKVTIPVTPLLKPILDYICDEPKRNGLVIGSFLGNVDINDGDALFKRIMYLNNFTSVKVRKVCKVLGLRDDVCTTFARHSFISVSNHLGFNFSTIEQMAGHTLPNVSGNYIGQVPNEKLFEIGNALIKTT